MKATRTYTMGSRAEATAATRERIAREAAQLFIERPYEDVTLVQIAKAAGVSHQTVLNHFESKEGVVGAVAEIMKRERMAAREVTPGDPAAVVRVLVGDYEQMGDANFRWAASEHLQVLAEFLDLARAAHQDWLGEVFDERLPATPAARQRAVHALHAATDVYVWKLLRRDLGLSRTTTEKTMTDLVVGILEGTKR